MRTSRLPDSPAGRDEADASAFLLTARIEIYGSTDLRAACEKAFAEIRKSASGEGAVGRWIRRSVCLTAGE
ncbi:hypothetical protein [Streptomyces lincolnensis]|uniref:hypothetical protein n=1 Tax=Streptomyces lincolnensis TaxID=1915 RepID=UPI00082F601A|nr:hypothetical protein [Streptomyces lincolnensis]QMV10307.1 hypothetical protein GJU35_34705 [Streptomyces lincolnensis]